MTFSKAIDKIRHPAEKTFSIMTLNAYAACAIMLSVIKVHNAECYYAECHYAECYHAECHYAEFY